MKRSSLIAALGVSIPLGLSLPNSLAADYTYSGSGAWNTSANWTPTITPDAGYFNTAGRNAVINGAVDYSAGDFLIGNGNTMTVNGSWTQAATVQNWVKIGGTGGGTGTVVVQNGGTFNVLKAESNLRLGVDGGTGVFTVASNAGGVSIVSLTEMSAASTLNIQGGTNSFANVQGNGIVNVSGGTTTLSGVLTESATGNIHITGGSITQNGNGTTSLNSASTFLMSGGSFTSTGTGEFQPGAAGGIQGVSGNASLSITGLVAFQGTATTFFNLSGAATITLGASAFNGIYSNGGYFNFTSLNSGSSIVFTNTGSGETNIFEGQIRYNGISYTNLNYTSVFNVTHPTVGTTVITAVPEPSTYAVAIGLGCFGLIYLRRRKMGMAS